VTAGSGGNSAASGPVIQSPPMRPPSAPAPIAANGGELVDRPTTDLGDLALVMSGGGARAAYQVGLLRHLARRHPQLEIPIITGVSAGAVNAAMLARHHGTFPQAVEELTSLWLELTPERVFRVDTLSLAGKVVRAGVQLASGGAAPAQRMRGMVSTEPLREFLEEALSPVGGELTGIDYNLGRGTLKAAAIITTSYTTGQSVIWVQGRDIETWERPQRRSVSCRLTLDHIMASTALPLFFPAVQVGEEWFGDGGIRLAAPLSPALHLGAHKVLAISTRYPSTRSEADRRVVEGYPPPAQVLGVLYNAIFLDLIDQDVLRMERMNRLLKELPVEKRLGMRVVELLVLRPSRDLGRLARDHEPQLPASFRFLSRGLGTRDARSADLLSMVMFQPDYLRDLIELGEADAEAQADRIEEFVAL
jgi:NTE family protein